MPPLPPHAVHILGALWAYKNNRKERSVTMWKIIQGSRSHHKYTIGRMNELFRWKRALTPISSIELKTKIKKKEQEARESFANPDKTRTTNSFISFIFVSPLFYGK